ncbi:MAG: dTDP-glucose 4,6-dehydratase [Gammaproteobacteria bacterium]|nr:dTDP-glucose 4,6-dehydratase [Gammaproteobacteria bacterium]
MRRLLVTGGAGFIGANFVHYWTAQHPQDRLVVLDALTYAGNRASLDAVRTHPQFRFVHGSICNAGLVNKLFDEERFDTVVHFAAESHVDRSITGPDAFVETNVIGTHMLLKAARRAWLDTKSAAGAHRFHHVSTDEVYGSLGPEDPPFTERTPYAPNSPYSASKAASDHLVRAYHHTYGLPATISNCSNNFGPYQFPEKLIPLMIVNALHAKPLPVYGDGGNVRDWLYVTDHVRGIELVLERGRVGETYNIGGGNERRNIDLVNEICGLLDTAFQSSPELAEAFPDCPAASGHATRELISFVTDRPGHDRRYAIDAGKISAECGYRPADAPAVALGKTVHWYLANRQWWQPLLRNA